jgi:hypothetical protein
MTHSTRPTPLHLGRQADGTPCTGCEAFARERARLQLENATMAAALAEARTEGERLRAQLAVLNENVRHLASQTAAAEAEGADLVKLHVSHCRLHESRTRADVMIAVEEILVTVVGCERYAIFHAAGGDLTPVASMGMHPRELRPVPIGADSLARVAHTGDSMYADSDDDLARLAAADIPVACAPIRERDGRVTGLIALYELLPHKVSFDATDRALLDLLSIEAARALDEVPHARVA